MKNTYKQNKIQPSNLRGVKLTEGMTIEKQVSLYLKGNIDVEEKTEFHYTERKDGVLAGYDVRSDKFDLAIDATDKATRMALHKRRARMEVVKEEEIGKTEPTQGTSDENTI